MSRKRGHRRHSRGFWGRLSSARGRGRRKGRRWHGFPKTLANVPPGTRVEIKGFRPLDTSRRQQLQAYGLSPGHAVQVIQHSPVTIIQAGHTELAMETDLAQSILVEVKS